MPKFHPVSPQVDLPAMEQDVLRFWKATDVFGQSQKQTATRPRYVFFEGPPTANGRPGIHHVLARAFKDIFRATRPCAGSMSRARVAGTRTACRSSLKLRRSSASPARRRSRSTASRPSSRNADKACSSTSRNGKR